MSVNRVLFISILTVSALSANWSDSLSGVWEETKKVSESVIDTTIEKSQELSKETLNLIDKLNISDSKCTTTTELEQEHLSTIWGDFLKKSTDGLKTLNKIEVAPEPSLLNFGDSFLLEA